MAAHLPQLHKDVNDAQEIARAEDVPDIRGSHVVLVQGALPLGQAALDDVLVLSRELLLHVLFESPEQEWPQHTMQPLHQGLNSMGVQLAGSKGPHAGNCAT